MQTFVMDTKMSRNILSKCRGKGFQSSINHTKAKKIGNNAENKGQVFPQSGASVSAISSLPPSKTIHKGPKQTHPGKPDLSNKTNLKFCTVCGVYVTASSE
jgi:hypothetical protein